MTTSGRDVLVEVLRTEGVTHVFGNPGTTELPVIDALAEAGDLHYVLGLQESTVVGLADGYAQATGRPAFVNLHTSAGLGNAIGNLTNAQANGTPLVVTAGQQDRRHLHHDPLLGGDLVGLAQPVSKWAHETATRDELGTILRRAFHDAASAPTGPVFVSIPMDVLDEEGSAAPPPSRIERRTVPADLDELATALAGGDPGRVAIVAGDEVAHSGAVAALVAVAETVGCRVHGAPLHGSVVFPTTHPLWAGPLPPVADGMARALAVYDTVLLVGGRAFMVYPWSPGPPVPEGTTLLHLSPDVHQLGRTWPTALGVAGDPRATLAALHARLVPLVDARAAIAAISKAHADHAAVAARFADKAAALYDQVPMAPAAAVHALLEALPPDPVVVDEAITAGAYVRGFHHTSTPGRYFFCRGGGLGWGMPAAVGVSLGLGREPVLCVVGDGSALYSPQALWTAAHEGLPVVFAVVNNQQYLILKRALRGRGGAASATASDTGRMIGMDLDQPPVDFVALARSFGVDATSVEKAHDVGDAAQAAWDTGRPHLLELPVAVP